MKTKFLALFMSIATVFGFTSCGNENKPENPTGDVTPTGINLSASTLEIEVGTTGTLAAVLTPTGATGTIVWESSDATIATVANGTVTGVKAGSAIVSATCGSLSAMCAVTVKEKAVEPGTDFSKSLEGSDYYVMILDATTYGKIENKVKKDYRPDDATKFLYIWEQTYTAGTASGPNFYGEVEGWTCLTVASVGWSGCGLCIGSSLGSDGKLEGPSFDLTNVKQGEGWVLHLGMKSQDNASHTIVLYDGRGTEAKAVIGATAFEGVEPYTNFTRNGEWQEIEIPMDYFFDKGLLYSEVPAKAENIMATLSGATAGTILNLDAAFIYKPAK